MLDDLKLEGQSPDDIKERHLFHGTDSENVCRGICTNSFDFRTSGKNATAFGEGSYFAVTAKYSHSYTKSDGVGMRFMFQAKVLTGWFKHPLFMKIKDSTFTMMTLYILTL